MRLHRLTTEHFLPIAPEDAWAFFSNPANLQRITPPWLNLKPTSPVPAEMHPGLIVTYAVAPFPGVRVNWVTEITHVVPGKLFVDEQRAGPYRFWHHQHHFEPAPGGTLMTDIVHYAVPFGVAGDLIGARMVHRRVSGIFAYRREVLERDFGGRRTGPPAALAERTGAAVGLA